MQIQMKHGTSLENLGVTVSAFKFETSWNSGRYNGLFGEPCEDRFLLKAVDRHRTTDCYKIICATSTMCTHIIRNTEYIYIYICVCACVCVHVRGHHVYICFHKHIDTVIYMYMYT